MIGWSPCLICPIVNRGGDHPILDLLNLFGRIHPQTEVPCWWIYVHSSGLQDLVSCCAGFTTVYVRRLKYHFRSWRIISGVEGFTTVYFRISRNCNSICRCNKQKIERLFNMYLICTVMSSPRYLSRISILVMCFLLWFT